MEKILFSLSVISSVIKPQNETSFSLWRESKDCLFRVIPWDWIEAPLQFLVVTMAANSKGQTHLFSFHVLLWHQLHHHSFGLSCYHSIHSVYNAANLPSIKCTLLLSSFSGTSTISFVEEDLLPFGWIQRNTGFMLS